MWTRLLSERSKAVGGISEFSPLVVRSGALPHVNNKACHDTLKMESCFSRQVFDAGVLRGTASKTQALVQAVARCTPPPHTRRSISRTPPRLPRCRQVCVKTGSNVMGGMFQLVPYHISIMKIKLHQLLTLESILGLHVWMQTRYNLVAGVFPFNSSCVSVLYHLCIVKQALIFQHVSSCGATCRVEELHQSNDIFVSRI